jgi:hypothetical protein
MNTFHLQLSKAELDSAFRVLKKLCKPRRDEEAVLSFDGTCLHIEGAGMGVTPRASGSWPGQVRLSAKFLLGLAKVPPVCDPIEFRVEDGRLHIASSSVACSVQPAWRKAIELPMNATDAELLALHFTHAPEDIEAAGYGLTVQHALGRVDSKIQKAAELLAEFSVRPEELRAFVHGSMRRRILEGEIQP